jgi:CO dehydrogenase/acetyl-CoA synthase beta subunit
MTETKQAKITDVKKFLADPDNPVETQEFREFWESLTEEEKEEFKTQVGALGG